MIFKILPKKSRIAAMAIWPFILARKGRELSDRTIRHERIHHRQQLELMWLPFFLWYFFEWTVKSIYYRKDAYSHISFEREAYANDGDDGYLKKRKFWGWVKYLRK